MTDIWGRKTDAELVGALDSFSVARHNMAAKTLQDCERWHHVACAELFAEAAARLRKAWAQLHGERTEQDVAMSEMKAWAQFHAERMEQEALFDAIRAILR